MHLVVQAEDEELGAVVEDVADKDDQHGSYDALIAVEAEPPFDHCAVGPQVGPVALAPPGVVHGVASVWLRW